MEFWGEKNKVNRNNLWEREKNVKIQLWIKRFDDFLKELYKPIKNHNTQKNSKALERKYMEYGIQISYIPYDAKTKESIQR